MCMDNCDVLAIVGNGFDLAHGLKTSYSDFVRYMLNSVDPQNTDLINNYFDLIQKYTSNDEKMTIIDEWYDFEVIAKKIVTYLNNAISDPAKSLDSIDEERKIFYQVFSKIENALKIYLNVCTNKSYDLLKSVKPYLSTRTIVLYFNYTDTIMRYNSKPLYIHGSLHEGEIVLGYDDFTDDGAIDCWNYHDRILLKEFEREHLAFNKWLSTENIYGEKRNNLIKEYEKFMTLTVSGRGLEDGDYDRFDSKIKTFKDNYKEEYIFNELTDKKFENIKHIVIIGHGIKSDKLLFDKIFMKINPETLKDITIFLHKYISLNEIKEQVDYLRNSFVFYDIPIRFEEYNNGDIGTVLLNKISDSINAY